MIKKIMMKKIRINKIFAERVKLIRSRILGDYSWGVYNTSNNSGTYSNYKNDWTGNTTGVKANANVLLNDETYLAYNDTRKFGILKLCDNDTYLTESPLKNVGPDPFMVDDYHLLKDEKQDYHLWHK